MRKLIATGVLIAALTGTANAAGWYLMIPPYEQQNIYWTAPLSHWSQLAATDLAYDCFRVLEKTKTRGIYDHVAKHTSNMPSFTEYERELSYGQCVSSDDPRLTQRP
jgi:hypothetical protein